MINLPGISKIIKKQETSKINLSTKKITKFYDYFSVRIPKNFIENIIKPIKDERFLFFIKYGILRRYEGECDIIYVEIPQIPKKLVIYRRPYCRMKSLNKLNLSRRDLPHIPLFEGEDNLKYLSLELNRINKIERLISLNNLIYLNLYGNYITEIENLSYTSKLRVLLLGKNSIDKIKNLNSLTDLEILDLHSNKIKLIENICYLKKLRILNLANNQITSISELVYNRNLEELNVRKNLIEVIPNMNDFQMLKKINIGKNLIKKLEYILEFNKLKYLEEIILENNPILNNANSIPQLKNLPLKGKISNYFSKTPLSNSLGKDKFSYESLVSMGPVNNRNINNINNSNNNNISINKSLTIFGNPNKTNFMYATNLKKKSIFDKKNNMNNTVYSRDFILAKNANNLIYNKNIMKMNMVTPTIKRINKIKTDSVNNMTNSSNEFYSKIFPIKQLWNYEINNIINKGFNGYQNKKYKEINIDQGHVEIEEESSLYLYGNCLKILSQNDFYDKINSLSFNYFCFDFIMSKKIVEYIKEFKNLINIKFSHNNLYSLYQLIKLETFENLEKLSIYENEICNGYLLKYFVLYRINTLKFFNNRIIKEPEIKLSKDIFQYFDKLISIKEKELNIINNENKEEKKNNDNNLIKTDINNDIEKTDEDLICNTNKINNIKNKLINENENINEDKYKFFNYAKFNLSIVIEEMINDEENSNI